MTFWNFDAEGSRLR
ncbi:607f9c60-ae71-44ec-a558-37dc18db9a20 [Thermothielavioides terrestris]|uniref:607f9c60-ae71-44ec-a558-37dc18db9a20 n=1 Tax=Thermothielavioides terrestris TaxID=2587410 RepID=A0A3S4C3K7_9PEZI|nr:607f9c60-ae71-44ec-a558-37dc18db9a20 [Thermothielavioides terrestris]